MTDGHGTIRGLFAEARAAGRTVLLPYLTAGLPDPESSPPLFAAMADAGADAFEVGFPYADPLMDGPVIHAAGLQALGAGADFDACVDVVDKVVTATGLPVLVMTYVNPVLRRGPDAFAAAIGAAGASGWIIADLPVDESAPFVAAGHAAGLGTVLFAAPTTVGDRLDAIVTADPAFVYCVARLGVTGEGADPGVQLASLAGSLRRRTDIPLVAGVGISTPEMAREARDHVDGVIVGTALVRRVLEAGSPEEAAGSLHTAVADLAAALHG